MRHYYGLLDSDMQEGTALEGITYRVFGWVASESVSNESWGQWPKYCSDNTSKVASARIFIRGWPHRSWGIFPVAEGCEDENQKLKKSMTANFADEYFKEAVCILVLSRHLLQRMIMHYDGFKITCFCSGRFFVTPPKSINEYL